MALRIPQKPFPGYKWRWAVLTPTESLNSPPVFLGILRVLRENEYKAFSSDQVNDGLQRVQTELKTSVNLVRTKDRNIFRNSGQYWRAFGLFEGDVRGTIELSNFGRKLADGDITQNEFAITILKTLELPNSKVDSAYKEWNRVGLTIKPLELILDIVAALHKRFGLPQAYLTPEELTDIVIPLAGDNGTMAEYLDTIFLFRKGKINLAGWPDCTPNSNDKRMAREFLLFLTNYGLCYVSTGASNKKEKYFLASISIHDINALKGLVLKETELDRIERLLRKTQIPANVERKKVRREILNRPNQAAFRKAILEAYKSTCLITGVQLDTVLEAAHIKPVKYSGGDEIPNGICLRADIHTLFDSNQLKLAPSGDIRLSTDADKRENYRDLPKRISIPAFINKDYLDWRIKYY